MASLGALAGRSLHKLIFALFVVSVCFASTVLAQESQREQPQPPKIIRRKALILEVSRPQDDPFAGEIENLLFS